jgi:hypothetical protein
LAEPPQKRAKTRFHSWTAPRIESDFRPDINAPAFARIVSRFRRGVLSRGLVFKSAASLPDLGGAVSGNPLGDLRPFAFCRGCVNFDILGIIPMACSGVLV